MRTTELSERYRMSGRRHEPNGFFIIPHQSILGYHYFVQISDGYGWEHVSVTIKVKKTKNKKMKEVNRCPTWNEMCHIKRLFWEDSDAVYQIHPPKSEWVSTHPYCLHLWKAVDSEFPRPPQILVGVPGDNIQAIK